MQKLGWKQAWKRLRFFSVLCLIAIALVWVLVLAGSFSLKGGLIVSGMVALFYVLTLHDTEGKVLCSCNRVIDIRIRFCSRCGAKNNYAGEKQE